MKKGILLAVCLMLVGMLSVGGTYASGETISPLHGIFAWLSDTFGDFGNPTDSDGSVAVENVYQVRSQDGKSLVSEQNNFLVPASLNQNAAVKTQIVEINGHSYTLWTKEYAKWAADKFISVQNTAQKAVFFRTAIAIQYDPVVWKALHVNVNTTDFAWKNGENQYQDSNLISIDGKPYVMLVATYRKTLQGGATSPAMMMQVALDDVSITNEQLANTLDMRVITMAIEADGFKDENDQPLSAEEALDLAVPLDENFKPFG